MKTKVITYSKFILTIILFFGSSYIYELIINIINVKQTTQLLIGILVRLIIIALMLLIYKKDIIKEWCVFKKNYKHTIKTSFTLWFYGLIAMVITNIIINKIVGDIPVGEQNIELLLGKYPMYVLISSIFIAPFIEELVFRKSFKTIITNPTTYIIISSLIFGLLHITTSVEVNNLYYLYTIPYACVGIAFAYMNVKTNTIFSSIMFHMIHNALTTLIVLI